MSRSRKKNAIVKDYSRSSTREYKRFASKTVRRYNGEISDGGSYQKIYPSYNIHDYRFRIEKSDEYWYKRSLRK